MLQPHRLGLAQGSSLSSLPPKTGKGLESLKPGLAGPISEGKGDCEHLRDTRRQPQVPAPFVEQS